MRRIFLGIIAAIAAAATISVVYVAMNFNMCDEKLAAQYLSPDGNRNAFVVVNNCGATTDYNTFVTVREPNKGVRLGDDFVFSVKGLNNIQIVWEEVWNPNRAHYTIVYDRTDRINRQITVWRGEIISYRER
jgi:hypothetical protein